MTTKKISKEQCVSFGQVAVLVLLAISMFHPARMWIVSSCFLLLINMMVPLVFYPFAWAWFRLGELLGNITSFVILSVVFIIVVIPVGIARKMRRKNPLKLLQFKKGRHSVFTDRHHAFVADDLTHGF